LEGYRGGSSTAWKRLGFLALSVSMTVSTTVHAQAYRPKTVGLWVDGKAYVVNTRAPTVAEFLKERGITLYPGDRVSPEPEEPLSDGQLVHVFRNKAIYVRFGEDGEPTVLHTTAERVGEALAGWGIFLREGDRVDPGPDVRLVDGETLTLVLQAEGYRLERRPIPFATEKVEDPNLLKGTSKVVREGREGEEVLLYRVVYENGVPKEQILVDRRVEREALSAVVHVGTKEPPKPVPLSTAPPTRPPEGEAGDGYVRVDGKTYAVQKVLQGVTLVAYTAGPESTGKTPGDPGYGRTALGYPAQEGRTIAVDPSVIPLRSWVYIEGYGLYRAEDVGGKVRGNMIDVYIADLASALRFGRKTGVTVYVLGPEVR